MNLKALYYILNDHREKYMINDAIVSRIECIWIEGDRRKDSRRRDRSRDWAQWPSVGPWVLIEPIRRVIRSPASLTNIRIFFGNLESGSIVTKNNGRIEFINKGEQYYFLKLKNNDYKRKKWMCIYDQNRYTKIV